MQFSYSPYSLYLRITGMELANRDPRVSKVLFMVRFISEN